MQRLWRRRSKRNTDAEKADIKAGRIPREWKNRPHKLLQKDLYAGLCGLDTEARAGAG